MSKLYPFKFKSLFFDKIWGGQKIKTLLNKDFGNLPNCGESWEVSAIKNMESIVDNGFLKGKTINELMEIYKERFMGQKFYSKGKSNEFPLLVKFINAEQDLSIQVHPDDQMAQREANSLGKNEMWYFFDAEKDAQIVSGFKKNITREQYLEAFNDGKIMSLLRKVDVKNSDAHFLKTGCVHSIGKGLLLAEIQQSSDITYRIYDFDRTDDKGNKRELHTEKALEAIDFLNNEQSKINYQNKINEAVNLVNCKYFVSNIVKADKAIERNYSEIDSFVILVCVAGNAEIVTDDGSYEIKIGETILIPAEIKKISIKPLKYVEILESYI